MLGVAEQKSSAQKNNGGAAPAPAAPELRAERSEAS